MKSVKWVKNFEPLNRTNRTNQMRETVETVLSSTEVGHTSLKRGVNEKSSEADPCRLSLQRGVNEKTPSGDLCHPSLVTRHAFTLIELLVVIAIMAVLAALIIPITGAVTRHKLRSRTKAELNLIASSIENYKTKKGYYPPDSPGNKFFLNTLYYELSGTVFSNGVYTTLDGNAFVDLNQIGPPNYKGFQGIVNTTKGGGDEGMAAQKYIRDLKPAQIGELKGSSAFNVKILVGSVGWENSQWQPILVTGQGGPALKAGLAPVCYVSSNPTNNPGKFDLWIDIMVQGKTNRICNWSDEPIVNP